MFSIVFIVSLDKCIERMKIQGCDKHKYNQNVRLKNTHNF